MSGDLVIVVHSSADEAFATQLAQGLAPYGAFPFCPVLSGPRPTLVGPGAICVVVWTEELRTTFPAAWLPQLLENALICCVDAVWPPRALQQNRAFGVVHVSSGELDVSGLRAMVADVQERRAQYRSQSNAAHSLLVGAKREAHAPPRGLQRFVMQSATGLSAALAVVGVATPMVSRLSSANTATSDVAFAKGVEDAQDRQGTGAFELEHTVALVSTASHVTPLSSLGLVADNPGPVEEDPVLAEAGVADAVDSVGLVSAPVGSPDGGGPIWLDGVGGVATQALEPLGDAPRPTTQIAFMDEPEYQFWPRRRLIGPPD